MRHRVNWKFQTFQSRHSVHRFAWPIEILSTRITLREALNCWAFCPSGVFWKPNLVIHMRECHMHSFTHEKWAYTIRTEKKTQNDTNHFVISCCVISLACTLWPWSSGKSKNFLLSSSARQKKQTCKCKIPRHPGERTRKLGMPKELFKDEKRKKKIREKKSRVIYIKHK